MPRRLTEEGESMIRHSLIAGAAGAVAVMGFGGGAWGQAVELTLVHPFPTALVFTKSCLDLVAKINKAGAGTVKVTVKGGDEASKMFQQPAAVRDGVVDMTCIPAAFYATQIPENEAVSTASASVMDVRKNGGMAILDRLHARHMKMKYLGWIDSGVGFYMFTAEPPKFKPNGLPDFSGVKLRDNPIYGAFFRALGASTHNMPSTEVYSALEKSVVNASAWAAQGLMQLKWDKFLRHRVGPAFYQTDIGVLMNLDRWNKLNAKAKDLVQKTVIEHEGTSRAARVKEAAEEQATLQKNGMQFHALKPEAEKLYLKLAVDSAYERMEDRLKKANRPLDDAKKLRTLYIK
jgi:TRAP-type C4-dicarboxylate transport system substrate-binding protein